METSMAELLLIFVLCVASWSSVNAENAVEITGCKTEIFDTGMISSCDCDVVDNRIVAKLNVVKDCPGSVQADIEVYKSGNLVNSFTQSYKQPFKEFQNSDICESIDAPDPDDDSCSVVQGDHSCQNCDVASSMKDMDPGDYEINCNFKINNNAIMKMTVTANIESA